MAVEQCKDPIIKLVYQNITAGEKSKTSIIAEIKSKAVKKYLHQFDRLMIKMVCCIDCTSVMMLITTSCLMLRTILLECSVPGYHRIYDKLPTVSDHKR